MGNREKREQWVRDATAITDAITAEGAGRYLCPLCLKWFADLDELSLEHAPPRSVGGRHVAVTCRGCNSRGGHTVDAELRRAETLFEFAERRMTAPMSATLRIGDVEQRGEAMFGPDRLKLAGVPKQNHPAVTEAITAALDEAVESGSTGLTISLSFRSPDFRKASIAWLRAAYLIAFATLGYLYILRKQLEPVRQQIHAPETEVLGRYCLIAPSARRERRIFFVEQPHELASVVVSTNNVAVLLPSDERPGTYERLAAVEPWPPGERTLTGKSAPWPSAPIYALDRAMLSGRREQRGGGAA